MWWESDEFNRIDEIPQEFGEFTGPHGIAIVKVFPNGKTDNGWGYDKFMAKYEKRGFNPDRVLRGQQPFAFVMRSLRLLCIDIDGKNGGLEHVGKLGMLPYTLAERSKSDNGYHLFYSVDDEWSPTDGFGRFKDRISIQQGVDLRAVGCVYHYPNQRWNHRPVVELPQHLADMQMTREQKAAAAVATITKTLETGDKEEIAIMHDNLLEDLNKPITQGRRNTTLFAIGSQLMLAGADWETPVRKRAIQVGLDKFEIDKLCHNIEKYGANA